MVAKRIATIMYVYPSVQFLTQEYHALITIYIYMYIYICIYIYIYIHSFIQTISIAPLQVHVYSAALSTQHGYCAGVSRRSATGNCDLRTCPRSLRDG